MYSIAEIARIIAAKEQRIADQNSQITQIFYDSRKISQPKEGLFFALNKGRDGHDFIPEAYQKGVRNFVVEREVDFLQSVHDVSVLRVDHTLEALQRLAAFHRQQFKGKVIGITGSNGKTIVKEWLYQLLSPENKIYRSPKSYNSQLGVALSLWQLNNHYQLAIIEAGISERGEMIRLQEMIKPDYGIFTNIGVAHKAGFESKNQKIAEKLLLFKESEWLIYPSRYIDEQLLPLRPRRLSWGEGNDVNVEILNIKKMDAHTQVAISFREKSFLIQVPFLDQANVENALTCVAVMLHFGYQPDIIAARIKELQSIAMRLELKKGKFNSSIIDDSYSNDLAALQIALEFLQQQQQHSHKILVLSDIPGVNETDEKSISKIRQLLDSAAVDQLYVIGETIARIMDKLKIKAISYPSTEDFIQHINPLDFADSTVLLKGARHFHFEKISKLLVARSHDTVLEINLDAMENNLNVYRSMLPAQVKLMAMVKAFSYGSGSYEVANLLQFNKVDYLTVAYADEGVDLRNNGITLPIMVMSPDENAFEAIVLHHLEPEIYSFRILHAFSEFLRAKDIDSFPIHLKVDTGMHRLGFLPEEIDDLIEIILKDSRLKIQSVFSHLVSASNKKDNDFTQLQINRLVEATDKLKKVLDYPFLTHIAATSGIENWPSAYFDMVRLGIGLYGIDMDDKLNLAEVNVLKTNVTQIKEVPKTETVGYNRHGVLYRDSKIATLKIGYADGYDRRFGNGVGKMLINGQLVKTVGDICMDMCMVDVTDIAVHEEDEVLVYPDIKQAAKDIGTIPYELLTSISQRVKRVYFYE